jgi:hypothetical protein
MHVSATRYGCVGQWRRRPQLDLRVEDVAGAVNVRCMRWKALRAMLPGGAVDAVIVLLVAQLLPTQPDVELGGQPPAGSEKPLND